jgi:predicted lipid-binding transport protein (Tim44 family)
MLVWQKEFAMTRTAPHPSGFDFASALRGSLALLVQVVIGMMLVLTAGIVAVMTAMAGVLLGVAALVMRFAGGRRSRRTAEAADKDTITLEARRTPRGWTVE